MKYNIFVYRKKCVKNNKKTKIITVYNDSNKFRQKNNFSK